jgi:RNA-splicing ligase RtcB
VGGAALAYFVDGTPEFQACIGDMLWAQDYARASRDQMMDNAMGEVFEFLGFGRDTRRINCHQTSRSASSTMAASSGSPARERSRPIGVTSV